MPLHDHHASGPDATPTTFQNGFQGAFLDVRMKHLGMGK